MPLHKLDRPMTDEDPYQLQRFDRAAALMLAQLSDLHLRQDEGQLGAVERLEHDARALTQRRNHGLRRYARKSFMNEPHHHRALAHSSGTSLDRA